MFFTDKSEVQSLEFRPRQHCFSKAGVEWNNIILNGAVAQDQPIIDLSHEKLTEVCFDLFGSLSFIEIFELYQALKPRSIFEDMDWDLFFKKSGRLWNQRVEQLFERLNDVPADFISWAFERKLAPKDLMPLLSLKSLESFKPVLLALCQQNPSRNEARQILDLLVDLHMMKTPIETLLPVNGIGWLESLKAQRFPETFKNDRCHDESFNPWPQFVSVVKQRQGDRLVRRLQIDFLDSKDLNAKISRISSIENHNYE